MCVCVCVCVYNYVTYVCVDVICTMPRACIVHVCACVCMCENVCSVCMCVPRILGTYAYF